MSYASAAMCYEAIICPRCSSEVRRDASGVAGQTLPKTAEWRLFQLIFNWQRRCSFSDQMPKFFRSFDEVDQLGV